MENISTDITAAENTAAGTGATGSGKSGIRAQKDGRPEETREEAMRKIFGAARKLFVHNGYNNTGVRDIALAAGTNVAMVNYYFGSKYNLFEQVFEQAFEVLWQRIFDTLSAQRGIFELLEEWIHAYYDVLLDYPQLPMFILNEVSIDPHRLTDRFKQKQPLVLFSRIDRRLTEEAANGVIKQYLTLDLMLDIISLSVFPFILRNLASPVAGVDQEQYNTMLRGHKEHVVEFVRNALRPLTNTGYEL